MTKDAKFCTIKKDTNASKKIQDKMKNLTDKNAGDEIAWKGLTRKPGMNIWRIKTFSLEPVPESEHGVFYDGDSYLILHTYENQSKKIMYDVFIWIGLGSTADEYGVAAYKMAELDNGVLTGAAVQHREVESNESEKFQSLFKKFSILKGGYESGFRKVENTFKPRLLHIAGIGKNVKVTEVSYRRDNLAPDDVFIIDTGEKIYQVNGKDSSKDEKFKGAQVANEIKSERGKCQSEIIEDYVNGLDHPAINQLPVKNKCNTSRKKIIQKVYKLWKLSDATGKLTLSHIKDGKCSKKHFDTKDVFIYDTNDTIFVWIGKKTSKNEKTMAMGNAQKYAEENNKNSVPMVGMTEGNEPPEFIKELE